MNKRLVNVLESLVILAILLVLVQTFLEDFTVLAGWGWQTRRWIQLAGFFFDLFFTLEFLIRLYYALTDRKAMEYLLWERGWIDFLASVPLLMFNSGPLAITMLTGGGAVLGLGGLLNLLKVIKAIRIARILRFLRVIKLFRRIKNVDSRMAQRHMATITAISVTVLVFSLLFFTLLSSTLDLSSLESNFLDRQRRVGAYLAADAGDLDGVAQAVTPLEAADPSLLIVRYDGQTLFSRYDDEYYTTLFGPGDYRYFQSGALELFFDLRPYLRQQSRESLLFFGIVILVVLAYLLLYSPRFALTVSDPIHVMRRGLAEGDYNLEVKIPPRHEDDDLFQLAKLYNEQYLPLKDRTHGQEKDSLLQLDQAGIQNLLEEENG